MTIKTDPFAPLTRDNPLGFLTRELRIEVTRASDEADAPLQIAFSSEAEVERYDWSTGETYFEILDHSPGAVDLSYAKDGLPFCVDHRLDRMVGILEDVRIDPDRIGRGVFRKGSHPDAHWVYADMRNDIRKKISFGYWPGNDYVQAKRADGKLERRYSGWKPFETSSVPVPADYDQAGVGRSAPGASVSGNSTPAAGVTPQTKESQVDGDETSEQGKPPAPNKAAERLAVVEREAQRKDAMLQIGEAAGLTLAQVNEYVKSEKSPDQMGRELLAQTTEKLRAQPKALVLTDDEQKRYSYTKLVMGLMNGTRDGFEFEVSDDIAKRMGRTTNGGAFYPTTGSVPFQVAERTQLSLAAGAGKGGELKFVEYHGFAEALRARMVLGRTRAQFINGLQGDFALTVQIGAGSFSWGSETANASLSSLVLAQRVGAPKVGQSATTFTRQLMRQSVEAIEPLVRGDILKIHARGVETAAYNGSGAANNPRGVLNTVGVNSVALGTNGAVPTYAMAVDMETEVASDNADADGMAFITTPRVRGTLRKTQEFSGTNGVPVWTGGQDGQLIGYPGYATNLMPSNLTKGSSNGICHSALFGDFSSLYVLEWGAAELMVDPLTSGPAIIKVMSYQLIDILVRYPESFAVCLDILP